MPSSLRIPAPYQPGLQALADVGDEAAAGLLDALRDETRLLTTDRRAEHVRDCVPELSGSADDIIEALLSLITLLPEEGNGAEQLASDVAYSQDLKLDDASRAEFSARLQAMLEIESLTVAARASDVVTEYGRVFHDARILNDLRPIFGPDPTQGPKAATLIATLKIDYHPPRGSLDSEFYALEHADLLSLRDVVDRAIAKHASLRQVMDKMSLPYWEYREVQSDLDH